MPEQRTACAGCGAPFEKTAAASSSTIFGCRCCGASVTGKTDGSFDKPGWRRIDHIDGPNAICPECAARPDEALSALREDGYENACLEPEKT